MTNPTIHRSASDRAIFVANANAAIAAGRPVVPLVEPKQDEPPPIGNRHERRRLAKIGRK